MRDMQVQTESNRGLHGVPSGCMFSARPKGPNATLRIAPRRAAKRRAARHRGVSYLAPSHHKTHEEQLNNGFSSL